MASSIVFKKQTDKQIPTFKKARNYTLLSIIPFYSEGGNHHQCRHGRRERKGEERKQIRSVEDLQTAL